MGSKRRKVLILGAAGRDFHDFKLFYRDKVAEHEGWQLGALLAGFLAECD